MDPFSKEEASVLFNQPIVHGVHFSLNTAIGSTTVAWQTVLA
jgi:hypothetical protein